MINRTTTPRRPADGSGTTETRAGSKTGSAKPEGSSANPSVRSPKVVPSITSDSPRAIAEKVTDARRVSAPATLLGNANPVALPVPGANWVAPPHCTPTCFEKVVFASTIRLSMSTCGVWVSRLCTNDRARPMIEAAGGRELGKLHQHYRAHVAVKQLMREGYRVTNTVGADGKIKLSAVKVGR